MSRKVILTVAPTGGQNTKAQNPHLPTQPDEIADVVKRCYDAGASIAAIHARETDDSPSNDARIYRQINDAVRERCDIIINNSTGGGVGGNLIRPMGDLFDEIILDKRLEGLDAGAEMATFDIGTMVANIGGRELLVHTSPEQCDRFAERFTERGIKPEWEFMNLTHMLQDFKRLIASGFDQAPYYVNFVLGMDKGFQGALPYTPRLLQQLVDEMPDNCVFCVSGIGPNQLPATTHSLLLGGHLRVGLEDNIYYGPGELATNEQLVERSVRIIHELGLEVATPDEARAILGL
ncbi:3-keto-5-aminohexanoate cleavage protein [Aeromicrobium sp.]|uniref:3-keto-5-aminohexanoate cleavage protein n=1 Tax=Aeromicrobium sp. TaxID=1871063 RepID=UPI0028ADD6DD|nr:3-keto-5-aminohexanoate cleavage protein [Aeromicrobium sp.]